MRRSHLSFIIDPTTTLFTGLLALTEVNYFFFHFSSLLFFFCLCFATEDINAAYQPTLLPKIENYFAYSRNNNDHKCHCVMRKKVSIKHRLAPSVQTICCRRLFFSSLASLSYLLGEAVINCKHTYETILTFFFAYQKFFELRPFLRIYHYAVTGFRGFVATSRGRNFPDCEILFSLSHYPNEPEVPLFWLNVRRASVFALCCLLLS